MSTTSKHAIAAVLLLALGACGGGKAAGGGTATAPGGTPIKTAGGKSVNVEAHNRWKAAMSAFDAADKSGWNDGKCDSVASKFEDAADAQGGKFAEAWYMVGVAHQACKRGQKAVSFFNRALRDAPKFCKARVGVGVDHVDSGRDMQAQREFERSVRDDPQCKEGYVNLARLQRQSGRAGNKEALNNLRRALAIDAQYLPAFNEMALVYLSDAEDNKKALDLAEVVCSQAQKIDKDYAPVYNTWGLIDLERGEIIAAAAKFQQALSLDSSIFEAHMNFARITIGFRGYEDARTAYAKALQLQPKNFEAQLGLGVALRGLEKTKGAEEAYKKAIALSPRRPEPYFNLGVLYQDFMNGTVEDMKRAKSYYDQFLSRAGGNKMYKKASDEITNKCKLDKKGNRPRGSKCVSGRFQNIDLYLAAMKEMESIKKLQAEAEAMEREQAAQMKQQEALEQEAAKKEAEAKKEADAKKPPAEEAKPPADKGKAPAKPEAKKK
jgi:tetratricopeptide (TPR) repeat protein